MVTVMAEKKMMTVEGLKKLEDEALRAEVNDCASLDDVIARHPELSERLIWILLSRTIR